MRAISIALFLIAAVVFVAAVREDFFGRIGVAVLFFIGGAVVSSAADRRAKRGSE